MLAFNNIRLFLTACVAPTCFWDDHDMTRPHDEAKQARLVALIHDAQFPANQHKLKQVYYACVLGTDDYFANTPNAIFQSHGAFGIYDI